MCTLEKRHLPERIDSSRLYLQKHDLAIAETMFQYVDQDRARLAKFMPWVQYTNSVLDEVGYILTTHEKWDAHELYDYSIINKTADVFMGNIGVHRFSWEHQRCEIGYWILGKFEGYGFVSESVEALSKTLFENGFNRIEIRCSSHNLKSAEVPKRLGFRFEGRLEEEQLENGKFRDTLIYALTKSAFLKKT
jgi:ribosomal-protein-serine acetyltransferase